MKSATINFEQVTEEVFLTLARNAICAVLDEEHLTWDTRDKVTKIFEAEITRLVNEDEEIRSLIRECVISWIRKNEPRKP